MTLSDLIFLGAIIIGFSSFYFFINEPALDAKTEAKKNNERIKLFASAINTIGLGILAASTITPIFGILSDNHPEPQIPLGTGIVISGALFSAAYAMYRGMRSEDGP